MEKLCGIMQRNRACLPPAKGPASPLPKRMPSAVKRAGRGYCSNSPDSQPFSNTCSLSEAVSQISMERKCDRFGAGYPTPCTQANSFPSHKGINGDKAG